MATHSEIIARADGVTPVRKKLAEHGVQLPDETVRAWDRRNSIPMDRWPDFERAGIASAAELLEGANEEVARLVSATANDERTAA